jgi:hypothetical protein
LVAAVLAVHAAVPGGDVRFTVRAAINDGWIGLAVYVAGLACAVVGITLRGRLLRDR